VCFLGFGAVEVEIADVIRAGAQHAGVNFVAHAELVADRESVACGVAFPVPVVVGDLEIDVAVGLDRFDY